LFRRRAFYHADADGLPGPGRTNLAVSIGQERFVVIEIVSGSNDAFKFFYSDLDSGLNRLILGPV
jgi:hypothetical protein